VGSSSNLSVRFYSYYSLRHLAKSNRLLERALLKYGFSNFSLEILEYCKEEDAVKREQYYMDKFKPDYNIVEVAGSTLGYKHTEESIKKMRDFILSDEVLARKKLATENATKAKMFPILVTNTKTGDTQEYSSITLASEALNVTKGAVSQALSNNRLIKKTYIIKSISSENG
jgi:NUMOD1 domain